MTSDYSVIYTSDANADTTARIARLLRDIGADPIRHEPEAGRYFARLDVEAAANEDELRRHLAPVWDAVVAIIPHRLDKLDAATNWNMAFTNMVRETNSTAWGNWTFDPDIRAGAVGILDPDTGSFTRVAELPDATIVDNVSYQAWAAETASTRFTQTGVDFEGGYFDPSSGEEVKTGLEASWTFSSESAMVSRATLSGRSSVDNFGVLVKGKAWPWLLEQAEKCGYANPGGGISQGFGVVTSVTTCIGGLHVAAKEKNSAFSLVGSIDGINAMTGGGSAQAQVKGSYKERKHSTGIDSRTWPVHENAVVPGTGEVAVYYQFTTFHGSLIMPTWIRRLGNFAITFDNSHGGTYIGRCSATYSVPGSSERQSKSASVSGGQEETVSGIPLDAYDIRIHVDFKHGGDDYYDIPTPLTQWLNGGCVVDLSGVWPWGSKSKIRAL
jgi:hypothetical protein